jgi:hypothetical protein
MANGLSKGMSINDIAKKHKVDLDILKQELKKGIKVEKEHTSDVKRAVRITMDHLFEDPKYYTKLAKIKLEENVNKDLVSEFMKHVMDELKLKKLPKITLSNDPQEAIDLRSWGGYQPSNKSIHIIVAKRHPADIFRTLAHELVHYKQDTEGRLKPDSGKTGSEDENEANSRAAVIMRNFAQAKPNLFEHLINEIGEIRNSFDWGFRDVDDDGNYFYRFDSPQNEYSVGITYNGDDSYELSFTTVGEMGQDTGEGVAIRVLSTVMEVALDFIDRADPQEIIFRPIKTKGEEDKRRFNVYGVYLRKNLPSNYNMITLGDTYRWIKK